MTLTDKGPRCHGFMLSCFHVVMLSWFHVSDVGVLLRDLPSTLQLAVRGHMSCACAASHREEKVLTINTFTPDDEQTAKETNHPIKRHLSPGEKVFQLYFH